MFTPIESTVKILGQLYDSGQKLLYLSNFHLKAFDAIFEKFEFFRYFKGGIVSSKAGLLKPDEKIFIKLSEEYGLIPEECVLVDDTKVNIVKAEELGFKVVLFNKKTNLEYKLNKVWEMRLLSTTHD